MHWRDISQDPNNAEVLRARADALTRALVPDSGADRLALIQARCRGKRVLDVGCVDHFALATAEATWLHRRVAEAARECIGVDLEPEGVAAMNAAGFPAVVGDITDADAGRSIRSEFGAFDTVVAGEVIEHLASPEALLRFAADVLDPGGELVLSSPNPYARQRVRNGARGLVWENADHICYVFPAGIVELAERTGFSLEYCAAVGGPRYTVRSSLREWLEGLGPARKHTGPDRSLRVAGASVSVWWLSPLDVLSSRLRKGEVLRGESAIYVLRKEPAAATHDR